MIKLSEKIKRVGTRFAVDAKTFKKWGNEVEQLEAENAALRKENLADPTDSVGWICPICHSVYAIWVAKCGICGSKTVTTDTLDWIKG